MKRVGSSMGSSSSSSPSSGEVVLAEEWCIQNEVSRERISRSAWAGERVLKWSMNLEKDDSWD